MLARFAATGAGVAPAYQTIRYVGGRTTASSGSTSDLVVQLTGLTGGIGTAPVAGDLVIVYVATASTADRDLVVAGYTEVTELYSNDVYDTNLVVAYKFMGGTPDTTFTITGGTQSASDGGSVGVQVWRNVDTSNPFDVTFTSSTGINSVRALPPAITPTTQNAVIVSGGAGASSSTQSYLANNNLDGFTSTGSAGTNRSVVGTGYKRWVSGTFTPTLFEASGTDSTNNSWAAVTMALRPAVSTANATFVSSSTTRSTAAGNTVTAPASIADGDLLVAVGFSNSNGLTVTPPAGFSVIMLDGTSANTVFIAVKTASGETGSYTFTWSTTTTSVVSVLVYDRATYVNTIGAITRATSATGTAASITPTYAGTAVAVFGHEGSVSISTPPSGLSQRAAATAATGCLAVYDLADQSAAATGAQSLVWSASGSVASLQFFITNEPNVAPEFVASASTQTNTQVTTLTINKPTGTVEGDLMVAVMARDGASGQTWTGDTSWTEVADQTSATPSLRIAYKVAGASEGSSYTFTVSSSGTLSGAILTYRYAAYDTIAGAFTTGANPLVLTSISPTQSQSTLLACGARRAASITLGTPTSMTARVTDSDSTSPSYIVCDQNVAKGPSGTRSMSTGSTADVAGIMLSIKPTRSL